MIWTRGVATSRDQASLVSTEAHAVGSRRTGTRFVSTDRRESDYLQTNRSRPQETPDNSGVHSPLRRQATSLPESGRAAGAVRRPPANAPGHRRGEHFHHERRRRGLHAGSHLPRRVRSQPRDELDAPPRNYLISCGKIAYDGPRSDVSGGAPELPIDGPNSLSSDVWLCISDGLPRLREPALTGGSMIGRQGDRHRRVVSEIGPQGGRNDVQPAQEGRPDPILESFP